MPIVDRSSATEVQITEKHLKSSENENIESELININSPNKLKNRSPGSVTRKAFSQQGARAATSNLKRSVSSPAFKRNFASSHDDLIGDLCKEANVDDPTMLFFDDVINSTKRTTNDYAYKADEKGIFVSEHENRLIKNMLLSPSDSAGSLETKIDPESEKNSHATNSITSSNSKTPSEEQLNTEKTSCQNDHQITSLSPSTVSENSGLLSKITEKDIVNTLLHEDNLQSPQSRNPTTPLENITEDLNEHQTSLNEHENSQNMPMKSDSISQATQAEPLSTTKIHQPNETQIFTAGDIEQFCGHHYYNLLRDLYTAYTHFESPNLPAELLFNLPSDVNILLFNFCQRNKIEYPAHTMNRLQDEEIYMMISKYHSLLINKIEMRKLVYKQQQTQLRSRNDSALTNSPYMLPRSMSTTALNGQMGSMRPMASPLRNNPQMRMHANGYQSPQQLNQSGGFSPLSAGSTSINGANFSGSNSPNSFFNAQQAVGGMPMREDAQNQINLPLSPIPMSQRNNCMPHNGNSRNYISNYHQLSPASNGFYHNQNGGQNRANSAAHLISLNKKNTFPKEASEILLNWLQCNKTNPYPNESQKEDLRKRTGLTMIQINNWFTNARRRVLKRWKCPESMPNLNQHLSAAVNSYKLNNINNESPNSNNSHPPLPHQQHLSMGPSHSPQISPSQNAINNFMEANKNLENNQQNMALGNGHLLSDVSHNGAGDVDQHQMTLRSAKSAKKICE